MYVYIKGTIANQTTFKQLETGSVGDFSSLYNIASFFLQEIFCSSSEKAR